MLCRVRSRLRSRVHCVSDCCWLSLKLLAGSWVVLVGCSLTLSMECHFNPSRVVRGGLWLVEYELMSHLFSLGVTPEET